MRLDSGATSTGLRINGSMAEPTRGLLDTSVLIDHDLIDTYRLPAESAIAAITLAELAAGPHATDDEEERARRLDRLQWVVATFHPIPFDGEATRAYGRVFAAILAVGRTSRSRLADLLIASTAAANGLPIYTRNESDFAGLEEVVDVVAV